MQEYHCIVRASSYQKQPSFLFFHAIEENLHIQPFATKENRFPENKQHRPKNDDVINIE